MVFGVGLRLHKGGGRREFAGIVAVDFMSMGNLGAVGIEGLSPQGVPPRTFSIVLFAPNCTLTTPMPSATVNNSFQLETTFLVNRGFGSVFVLFSTVTLGRTASWLIYEVSVSDKGVSLSHYNSIARLPIARLLTLATISSLL
jgi:hypothetical protein